jgi:hypothetical protein
MCAPAWEVEFDNTYIMNGITTTIFAFVGVFTNKPMNRINKSACWS